MKTISAMAILAALTITATSASAQAYGHGNDSRDHGAYEQDRYGRESRPNPGLDREGDRRGYQNLNQRQQRLDWRIERGLRDGALNHREARRLREEFRQIAYLEMRYRAGGLSGWERADLDRRLDRLESRLRHERRDNDYGYGYYR
jgi:hypothetical protein